MIVYTDFLYQHGATAANVIADYTAAFGVGQPFIIIRTTVVGRPSLLSEALFRFVLFCFVLFCFVFPWKREPIQIFWKANFEVLRGTPERERKRDSEVYLVYDRCSHSSSTMCYRVGGIRCCAQGNSVHTYMHPAAYIVSCTRKASSLRQCLLLAIQQQQNGVRTYRVLAAWCAWVYGRSRHACLNAV